MIPPLRLLVILLAAAALNGAASAQTSITVDVTKPVRVVDDRVAGLNAPFWDSSFSDAKTLDALQQMDTRFLRFGGGSATDEYDWRTGKDIVYGNTETVTLDAFAAVAKAINAQAVITTNYGSGTAQDAADYVTYANVTKAYGFKYWEVGNECYGTWEHDTHAAPHDPYTYGTQAAQYIQAMRAADPSVKIGVVAAPGEDAYANSSNTHPATNPRTGVVHNGWVPVMLTTMKAAGVTPDFIIDHRYEQNPGQENDATLLQDTVGAGGWSYDATNLRQMLTDYLGAAGSSVEILVTENNSVSSNPGKQSTSLVNALYLADSTANLMQTEINSLVWWDLHNGQDSTRNNSASLYGWRQYGDYGIESGSHDRYPVFYVAKLMSHFARGGDTVVTAASNANLLSAYAAKRKDGSLSLLLINKSPTVTQNANITLTGYSPQATATVYSYGIPQDNYSQQSAAASTTPSSGFSWENSFDGWVNQSGQPDDTTTNFGLNAPYLYSLGYSTSTGVTNGSYSLACTTTAASPGNSAVIQNSTAAIGTSMSTAGSVSVDIYPQIAAGSTVQASIYINGKNISIGGQTYVVLGTVTLNANQENTATFSLTDAQRAGIVASLGTSNWFQVGININASAPVTAYLDNFTITPLVAPTPTPTPTPIAGAASSPDLAVSTISNAAGSFTFSAAPYSATLISLTVPSNGPVASVQPTSQTVATGGTAVFTFAATGAPVPTYQWYLNSVAIPSATGSTLVIKGATSANAGTYTCVATNSTASLQSSSATLAVSGTVDVGRLVNISCRSGVGTGGNILIAGFVSGGVGTSGTQPVLIRGTGPALAAFGVGGTLPDPQLQLYKSNPDGSSTLLLTNAGWGGSASITAEDSAVGAFALANSASKDSALYVPTLAPGGYTAQIAGATGDTGVSLAEVYDATPAGTYTPASPRIINISARVQVGTGTNILIAGFVIGGSTSKTVLIRASGPALAQFGVTGTLADPQLKLYRSNSDGSSTFLQSNNGWGGDAAIRATAPSVGAFAWNNSSSNDSALLVTLPPGGYTVQVAGAAGTSGDTGVALVEVYDVP